MTTDQPREWRDGDGRAILEDPSLGPGEFRLWTERSDCIVLTEEMARFLLRVLPEALNEFEPPSWTIVGYRDGYPVFTDVNQPDVTSIDGMAIVKFPTESLLEGWLAPMSQVSGLRESGWIKSTPTDPRDRAIVEAAERYVDLVGENLTGAIEAGEALIQAVDAKRSSTSSPQAEHK